MKVLAFLLILSSSTFTVSAQSNDKERAKIYLIGGAVLNVDEVSVTTNGVWYRRGDLSLFIEISRITRVIADAISFPANKAAAAKMVGPVSMAVSGRLLYPYVTQQFDYHKPSIDSPTEITYDDNYIIFHPDKVRIFSPTTGEIFAFLQLAKTAK
jgi:hypothetical protein